MAKQIALISEHASPLGVLGGTDAGGQNVYVAQVAKNLAALGYVVDVFTRRDDPRIPETVEWENGIRVIHVPAGPARVVPKELLLPHMAEFSDFMIRFCKFQRQAYDLIHANFFMSGLVACKIKAEIGTPFVITFHALGKVRRQFQGEKDLFPNERFAIEEQICSEADQIIAECPQDKEDLIRLYHASPEKITIVPCGFDPSELWPVSKPLARQSLGLQPNVPVYLQLGRMVPRKGVDDAIRGFARFVKDKQADAVMLIVGGDGREPDPRLTPEIGRLMTIAKDEGVERQVRFVGSRSRGELRNYFSAADVFISTPWYEPFGITPVEAMACGTPVIGSNVGGIKYSIRDGETGYLVPAKDPDALAERLGYLHDNPELLGVLSRQAVQRANDIFTWSRVANGLAAIFETILEDSRQLDSNDQLALVDLGFNKVIDELARSRQRLRRDIVSAAEIIVGSLARGDKVLVAGFGAFGDYHAQYAAARFMGHLTEGATSLPAIALTSGLAQPGAVAAQSQAVGRQILALGGDGDVFVGIVTGDHSDAGSLSAFETAKRVGMKTIALRSDAAAEHDPALDCLLSIPGPSEPHALEARMVALNLLCDLVTKRAALDHEVKRILARPGIAPVDFSRGKRHAKDDMPASSGF